MENIQNLDSKSIKFINSLFFVILLGSLTAFDPLSIDMYLPAFPLIKADLNTTMAHVELSLSSFFIGMSLGQLIYGPLADRFGRKKPLLWGMTIYMIATLLCAITKNINLLIAMRVFQAFGGCAGMVITRAIVRDVFEPKKMTNFFSSLGLVMGLAPILAPSIGGFIVSFTSWRAIFYLLFIANMICFFAIFFLMPETHTSNRKKTLNIKEIVSTYIDLLKDKHFISNTIPDSFIRAGMFAYIAGSPFVFMEIYHLEAKLYGQIFGLNAFGLISASQINRLLIKKNSSENILKKMRPFTLIAAFLILILPIYFKSIFYLIFPLFLYLFTFGIISPNSSSVALLNQGHRAGMASAMFGTIQWGSAIIATIIVSTFHNGSIFPMTMTMFCCALISVVGSKLLANS